MTFREYIDKIIARYELRGQNAVAREIGIASSSMARLTTGHSLPSDETMTKLADLAGIAREKALVDLNIWRCKNKPELQQAWLRVAKILK